MALESDKNVIDRTARKGAAFLVGGTVIQAIVGLLAQIIVLRHLLPEDLGRFVLVLASATLIQSLISLRINILIVRADPADLTPEKRKQYQYGIFWEVIFSGVLTLGWLWLTGLLDMWAAVLLISLVIGHWSDHNKAFFERKMPYVRLAFIETGANVAGHCAAIILISMGAGAATLYLRELIAVLLRTTALIIIGAIPKGVPRWLKVTEWKDLFREAMPVWLDGLGESVFSRLMLMVVSGFTGMQGLGLFSQAHRLAGVPLQFLAPFVSRIMINWFSRLSTDHERRKVLYAILSVLVVILTITAVLAVLFADPIVPYLFGPAWSGAANILAAMAGVILFSSLFETMRAFCLSQRKSHALLFGRIMLYVVFFGGTGILWLIHTVNTFNLALLLSVAIMASFVVMLPAAFRVDQQPHRT